MDKRGRIPRSDSIKVMHVITRFDKGGSAENTSLTVRGLGKTRYDIILIAGAPPPSHPEDPEALAAETNIVTARAAGVRLIHLPHLIRKLSIFSDCFAFFSLMRIIRREKPLIVHTHTSKAGILGRWAAWCCRIPIIIHTPHGHVFWGYFKPWQTRLFILLERWTARVTDTIVTLTPRERDDHLRFRIAPKEKFAVIHSGVDLQGFQPGLHEPSKTKALLGIPAETTVIGTMGRLTPVKGQETLIRAISDLIRRGEKMLLLLLGEGELRQDLEQLVIRLGIAEQVRFLGWRSDVARIMAVFDIFCLPSRNEGMGKVLVEAMAMGKPIVASDIGGIPDLVRPGVNGILVPVGDTAAWTEAIARLCCDSDERRRMGDAGMKTAPHYSAEEMIQKIDQMYKEALNQKNIACEPGIGR
jgi:glycosyltransferase involved in cell wall biosynthesis